MTKRLGILGGGQLARMLVQAAIPLGIETVVLANRNDEPAALVSKAVVGEWNDRALLDQFAQAVDVVVLENEFIGSEKLAYLASKGVQLVPDQATLGLIEDKAQQKLTLADAGLPVPALALIESLDDVAAFGAEHGFPLMLKTRRNGYDGRGTAKIRSAEEIASACSSLGFPENPVFVEAWVPFEAELATLIIRSVSGEQCVYPVIETYQPSGVCRVVRAPAPFSAAIQQQASEVAQATAAALGGLGILAVEMFLTSKGQILVNELAPRPHNTGHYSIEGCYCSQFENTIRAALGWPLGDPQLRHQSAVMVNVLAPTTRPLESSLIQTALKPQVHVHWYDKRSAKPGRKIGHITAVGAEPSEVEARAQAAVDQLERVLAEPV